MNSAAQPVVRFSFFLKVLTRCLAVVSVWSSTLHVYMSIAMRILWSSLHGARRHLFGARFSHAPCRLWMQLDNMTSLNATPKKHRYQGFESFASGHAGAEREALEPQNLSNGLGGR